MSYPISRAFAAASAAYGLYRLVRPDHVHRALGEPEDTGGRRLAWTYAGRDLPISALGYLMDRARR